LEVPVTPRANGRELLSLQLFKGAGLPSSQTARVTAEGLWTAQTSRDKLPFVPFTFVTGTMAGLLSGLQRLSYCRLTCKRCRSRAEEAQ